MNRIENEYLSIGINQKGAELASVYDKNRSLQLLWQADPEYWGRHSCILFPFIGKLKSGQYEYNGQIFHLGQHGFVRNREYQLISQSRNKLSFSYHSTLEDLKIYPFSFESIISYEIVNRSVSVTYQIINRDNKKMYFSIGAHPGFTCPIDQSKKRSNYKLVFNKSENAHTLELDENGLISESTRIILDGTDTLGLADNLFDRDALIFQNLKSTQVTLVDDLENKIWTFDFEGFQYLGIWSKNRESPFICIEPWYGLADYHNATGRVEEKIGIEQLASGEIFSCTHKISVHKDL